MSPKYDNWIDKRTLIGNKDTLCKIDYFSYEGDEVKLQNDIFCLYFSDIQIGCNISFWING